MLLDGHSVQAITAAALALQRGELVGLPTETVYGLGGDASQPQAVAEIFSRKGRPADHPLIVHVATADDCAHFADPIAPFAQRLMQAFWPGPLTLILPRRADVARAAAGGQDTVGLRCPSHPVAQALLVAAKTPLAPGLLPVWGVAAPSANRFGRVSPTTAAHVQQEFGDTLLVLDGGACAVGIESTIVDCSRGVPVLLRPGVLTRAQIEAACGMALVDKEDLEAPTPRASGTLVAHYAPQAKVRLMDAPAMQTALDLLGKQAKGIACWSRTPLHSPSEHLVRRRMPDDAQSTAQQLFAVLRDFDAQGVVLIWIETPPQAPEWEGITDRLQRAQAAE